MLLNLLIMTRQRHLAVILTELNGKLKWIQFSKKTVVQRNGAKLNKLCKIKTNSSVKITNSAKLQNKETVKETKFCAVH